MWRSRGYMPHCEERRIQHITFGLEARQHGLDAELVRDVLRFGDGTRYELLAPGTAKFRILYEVTATTQGSREFFNVIRLGSVASDEAVYDRMTGAPLAWEPWLYPLYYVALLFPRQAADDARCAQRYGPLWATYVQRVPWRIIPWVY